MFEKLLNVGFEVLTLHHAEAILKHDMASAAEEIESVLVDATLPADELVRGGGGEGELTQRLRRALTELGWRKHSFEVKKIVDGVERESVSHEVDHVKSFDKGTFALEIDLIATWKTTSDYMPMARSPLAAELPPKFRLPRVT